MYSLSPHHDENCWHQAPPVDSKKKHHTTNHLSPSYDLHQTEHDETRGQKAPPSGSEKKHQTVLLFPTSYLWRVDGRASVFSSQPHPSLSLFTFTFHFFFVIIHLYLLITNHLKRGAIASKAREIHVSKFVNVREFCPMQQKTIPVENYANNPQYPILYGAHHQTFDIYASYPPATLCWLCWLWYP